MTDKLTETIATKIEETLSDPHASINPYTTAWRLAREITKLIKPTREVRIGEVEA